MLFVISDFSELQSFVKDVSKFGVVSVTEKHCSTSLVKEAELHAQIPQESKLGTRHFVYSYERLEITSIFLYFIHILPNIFKVSSIGFHGNQYFF
jgi:selenophosphate synthetase-related protein